jgi:oligopeptidase A
VLAGLFTVVTRLYGVRIVANPSVEVYHPDVRFFDVLERDGTPRGGFFLDLYARPKKRGGAWMDECVGRIRTAETSALPIAYLVCNFSPAAGEQPSLLTHHEVLTLFHEFGHGLHHMLTRVDYPERRGHQRRALGRRRAAEPVHGELRLARRGAAVDLGACRDRRATCRTRCSRDCRPAATFQAGMQTVRQLEFALFDFRLHAEYAPDQPPRIAEILAEVRAAVAVVRPPEFNRFPYSFQHVFSGGYAAGYYSYKWAEVLSADAFGAFEEQRRIRRRDGTPLPALDPRAGRQPRRDGSLRRVPRPQARDRTAAAADGARGVSAS